MSFLSTPSERPFRNLIAFGAPRRSPSRKKLMLGFPLLPRAALPELLGARRPDLLLQQHEGGVLREQT